MNTKDIGAALRERRATIGITQQELAEASGVSVHTVLNLESGKGNPRLETLLRIAEILGLTLELKV